MDNNRFTKRLDFSGANGRKIVKLVAEISSNQSRFKVQSNLSPQMIERLTKSVLITSSGASTRIEGSMLSDQEVKELYSKQNIKKFKSRDEQEVVGYLELLYLVFESWKSIKFGENVIKQFHGILLGHSEKDTRHKGNYKFGSNRVEARDGDGNIVGIIFDPTPPNLVSLEMQSLVDYTIQELAEADFHPLIIIGNFIFEYLAIHPFQDGNGRSSRALTNLLMLQSGFGFMPYISHEKIIEENKIEYYKALNQSQKSWKTEEEDISSCMLFFLEVVKTQSINAVKLIENKENMELILTQKQLLVWDAISLSDRSLSRSEIEKITQINVETIRQTITKLIKLDKIIRLGMGNGTTYKKNPKA
jgi:Fic family protein